MPNLKMWSVITNLPGVETTIHLKTLNSQLQPV